MLVLIKITTRILNKKKICEWVIVITKNKPKTLVEITEDEFLDSIVDNINYYNDEINKLRAAQTQFVKLFNSYKVDKDRYRLKFFIQDNSLTYIKEKYRIGFRIGGKEREQE